MPKIHRMPEHQRELGRALRDEYGWYLSPTQVQKVLGAGSLNTAKKWLLDVPKVIINGRPKYQATDIAEKLERARVPV